MKNKKIMPLLLILFISVFLASCNGNSAETPDDSQEEEMNDGNNDGDNTDDNSDKDNNSTKWKTYANSRFNFSIDYPKDWEYKESDNGDGITFFTDDDKKDIRVYGANYMEDVSEPYKSTEEKDLEQNEKTLKSGIESTIIKGEVDGNYHYEMVYVKDKKEYHFISTTPIDYYNENKEMIEKMVNSFNITKSEDDSNQNGDNNSDKEEFTKQKAISIEDEFMNRLFIERDEGTGKVKDYDSKKELINHISEVVEESIAESYVNNYYKEKQDGLYIIAKDGPTRIYKDKEYKLEKINDKSYKLIQEAEDNLRGKYRFTVKFIYENDNWIISDRIFEKREQDSSNQNILGDNLIVKSLKTLKLLKEKDMEKLSLYVHPEKGVRFSPYSYVDIENDQVFKRSEVANLFENDEKYKWGNYDGKGTPINQTFKEYYNEFIYSKDFINPDIIGNDMIIGEGNTTINIDAAYPDGKFIEYYISGENEKEQGMDWQSLRLVFEQEGDTWYLVGIVHGQWTI